MIYYKMKAVKWSQQISHYKSKGIFPDAQGQLTPQSQVWTGQILNPSKLFDLPTCKNEEDPIKNEGARVVTTLSINFEDDQGELTP